MNIISVGSISLDRTFKWCVHLKTVARYGLGFLIRVDIFKPESEEQLVLNFSYVSPILNNTYIVMRLMRTLFQSPAFASYWPEDLQIVRQL